MKMQEFKKDGLTFKKVGDKTYVRAYGPNFYRLEEEWGGEKAYYHIYINNEDVETCPLEATEDEVRDRFLEICDEHGIEDTDMYIRKEF